VTAYILCTVSPGPAAEGGPTGGGGATCVDVSVEWLGRGGDGNSSSSFCTWGGRAATTAAVSELQGLIKGVVLALVKVQPEAACRTCCLDGIIDRNPCIG
jgi:hypothetical protein